MYPANIIPHFTTWGKPPEIWINPADSDKRILNGSDISQLRRKYPSALEDPQQSGASQQPAFQASGINGRGCAETDDADADDILQSDNFGIASGRDFVIFCVFIYNAPPPGLVCVPISVAFYGTTSTYRPYILAPGDYMFARMVDSGGSIDIISSLAPLTRGATYLAVFIYDFSNNYHEFRLNGVTQGTGTTGMTGSAPIGTRLDFYNLTTNVAADGLFGEYAIQFSIPQREALLMRERNVMNAWGL